MSANHDTAKGWVVDAGVRRDSDLTTTASRFGGPLLNCTLLGCICSDAGVQPFLPQVMLPRPRSPRGFSILVRDAFSACGAPMEFWHGTNGWCDHESMKHWATRLRSVVQSCHGSQTWILLVLDCANCHLDTRTVRHLRSLGILVLFIPSKLTYLLQPCDVEVFGPFKEALKRLSLLKRIENHDGSVSFGDWLSNTSSVVHGVISNVDWSDTFPRLGLSRDHNFLMSDISKYVAQEEVGPRLPSLAEFAELIGRPAHTATSQSLYRLILASHVELADKLPGSMPKSGLQIDVPVLPAAPKRPNHWSPAPDSDIGHALHQYLSHSRGNAPSHGVAFREARHFDRPIGARDAVVGPAAGIRAYAG